MRLSRDGATIVVFTGIDTDFTPVFRPFRGKVAIYNENIRAIAERYDCIVADQWGLKEVQVPRFFDSDRLHYNSLGHHEVARMVLRALNVPNDLQPMQPDPLPVRTWRGARTQDFVWARTHFVPGPCVACGIGPLGTRSPRSARPAADPDPRSGEGPLGRAGRAGLAAAQCPDRDGGGRGHVERVDAAGHRDRDDRVGRRSARRLSPSPSAPISTATRSGRSIANSSRGTASSVSASAARWKPSALRMPRASGHSGRRVHGTWNTVPMLTRTLRR